MHALRSNRTILTGVAVFVIGAGLTLLGLRASDASDAEVPRRARTNADDATAGARAGKGGFNLPAGTEAVAVSVDGAPGLPGYAGAGDVVNVYASVKSAPGGAPFTKRILTRVRVLDVTAPPRGGRGESRYLLALPHADAERLIFAASFEKVWLSLARADQDAARATTRTYSNSF